MDTNEITVNNCNNVLSSNCKTKDAMEIEVTLDDCNSCKQTVSDEEKSSPIKDVIEIHKKVVMHGNLASEAAKVECKFATNEQTEENIGNDKPEKNIQEESKIEEEIGKSTEPDVEKRDAQKSVVDGEGNSAQIKEAIEILNVEVVVPGNLAHESGEVECEFVNNEETESNISNEKRGEAGNNIEENVKLDVEKNEFQKSVGTGLSLLAQYHSDNENNSSDSESVVEVPISSNQDYRNNVVEINSETDSDDSDSDVEYLNELRKTIDKRIETVDDDDEEADDNDNEENPNKKKYKQKLKVKGELLLEDLPPIQDLKITVPEDDCIEFGKIHSIVDQLVLVTVLPNSIYLDLETVLFMEKGQKVLGEVFDVLGQVADPLYCVRFNSNEQIQEKQIKVGDIVYVAPKTQYTRYVILSNLMKQKGSDASWKNDIEPPPRFLDYSDDEEEQLARRQLRNLDRPVDNDEPTKKLRTVEEDEMSSISGRSEQSTYSRGNRRGFGHRNSYSRPRGNAPNPRDQRPQNYNRESWHSNYYPHQFPPPHSYRVQQPNQTYPPQYRMYSVPPMQNMPYAPLQTQYVAAPPPPVMYQVMPDNFNVRPATLQGPHTSHVYPGLQQPPPPPPGSQ